MSALILLLPLIFPMLSPEVSLLLLTSESMLTVFVPSGLLISVRQTVSLSYVSPQLHLMQYFTQRALEITWVMTRDYIILTCTQKWKFMLSNSEPLTSETPLPECGQYMCSGKENCLYSADLLKY